MKAASTLTTTRGWENHREAAHFETQLKNYQLPETLPATTFYNETTWLVLTAAYGLYTTQRTMIRWTRHNSGLKFEELFYIQLEMLHNTDLRSNKYKGFVFGKIGNYFNTFIRFTFLLNWLTHKACDKRDPGRTLTGRQMNRLLQGDVGSGKTLVAVMCMLIALDNGFQACLMALPKFWQNSILKISARCCNLRSERATADRQHQNRPPNTARRTAKRRGSDCDRHSCADWGEGEILQSGSGHHWRAASVRCMAQRSLWQKLSASPHSGDDRHFIPRTLAMTLYGDSMYRWLTSCPWPSPHTDHRTRIDNKRVGRLRFHKTANRTGPTNLHRLSAHKGVGETGRKIWKRVRGAEGVLQSPNTTWVWYIDNCLPPRRKRRCSFARGILKFGGNHRNRGGWMCPTPPWWWLRVPKDLVCHSCTSYAGGWAEGRPVVLYSHHLWQAQQRQPANGCR